MAIFLPNYLESIKTQDISIVDILYRLTEEEIKYRGKRTSKIQVSVVGFSFEKEIKDFDFSYQPGINKQQMLELESLRFMENILFVGSSGVGKTHLAIAIGIAAAKKRYLTYLDRSLHHSSIIKITGTSYRLKDKLEEVENKKVQENVIELLHFLELFYQFHIDFYNNLNIAEIIFLMINKKILFLQLTKKLIVIFLILLKI